MGYLKGSPGAQIRPTTRSTFAPGTSSIICHSTGSVSQANLSCVTNTLHESSLFQLFRIHIPDPVFQIEHPSRLLKLLVKLGEPWSCTVMTNTLPRHGHAPPSRPQPHSHSTAPPALSEISQCCAAQRMPCPMDTAIRLFHGDTLLRAYL